jgi:hypothetical protein
MKTPREILLDRHRAAGPRLDAVRRAVVAELHRRDMAAASRRASLASWFLRGSTTFWRELILPSRRLWAGLAAIWILLFIINISQRDPASSVTGQPVRSPAVMMSWQDQQRWMNELLADRSTPVEADRPRIVAPKPRTQVCETAAV